MPGCDDGRIASDNATLAAFLVAVMLAGGNAVAIRYTSCAGCELDPFWGAATRFALAGAIILVIMCVLRVALPPAFRVIQVD